MAAIAPKPAEIGLLFEIDRLMKEIPEKGQDDKFRVGIRPEHVSMNTLINQSID